MMEPTRIEVTVYRYDCGHPGHRHMAREVAVKCMERRTRPRKRSPVEARRQAYRRTFLTVLNTGSLTEASKQMGKSKERVRQMVYKILCYTRNGYYILPGLDNPGAADLKSLLAHADYYRAFIKAFPEVPQLRV